MNADSSMEMSRGDKEDIKWELNSNGCNENKVRFLRRKHYSVFIHFRVEVAVLSHCQLVPFLTLNQQTRFSQITAGGTLLDLFM